MENCKYMEMICSWLAFTVDTDNIVKSLLHGATCFKFSSH